MKLKPGLQALYTIW